jgi:hypothetical protein
MKFTILEPMSTGDVIDRTVRLYRRNFTPLIAIVAVPTLIGYVVSLMVSYGYTNVVMNTSNQGGVQSDAIIALMLGLAGYPVWGFILLLTVCGLARVVGDNLMLGEPITFRRCFAAVRGKVGSVIGLGFMLIALMVGLYFIAVIFVIALVVVISLIAGVIAAMHLPQWAMILLVVIVVLLVIAVALFAMSFVLARFIFMPQVMMIEGETVGSALGRSFRLGKGNWHRVLAIMLFAYFITASLLGALSIATGAILYVTGFITEASLTSPLVSILYTSFSEVSRMLALPIWIVSFTLLYFDSRVRKEAYDIELLAREVAPGYIWQAPPAFAGYYPPREYVQTSPLGLGGYYPPAPQPLPPTPMQSQLQQPPPVPQAPFMQTPPVPPPAPMPVSEPPTPADPLRARFEEAARSLSEAKPAGNETGTGGPPNSSSNPSATAWCQVCGSGLVPDARFCQSCGAAVSPPVS